MLRDREQAAGGVVGPIPSLSPSEVEEFWARLLKEVRSRRPVLLSLLEKGFPLWVEEGSLTLAFPAEETLAIGPLRQANNRKFVEGLAGELLGEPYRLRIEIVPPRDAPP